MFAMLTVVAVSVLSCHLPACSIMRLGNTVQPWNMDEKLSTWAISQYSMPVTAPSIAQPLNMGGGQS